jgi:hypothetical protein
MKLIEHNIYSLLLLLGIAATPIANAHLMVAQHGTLNFLHDDVFMVLSVPMSAFKEVDSNKDGNITMIEFNNHRTAIIKAVKNNVSLMDNNNRLTLNGLMLSPVVPHHGSAQPITQLTLMGKFKLPSRNSSTTLRPLKFKMNLFGQNKAENTIEITATNKADNKKHIFELNPNVNTVSLFTP